MQITDLLKPQSVLLNADPVTKADAIYTLGELMEKGGNLIDKGEYLAAVFAREESGSTGLGDGIATPHAKSAGVKEAGLAAMVVPHGVDFEALDGQPSRLFYMSVCSAFWCCRHSCRGIEQISHYGNRSRLQKRSHPSCYSGPFSRTYHGQRRRQL